MHAGNLTKIYTDNMFSFDTQVRVRYADTDQMQVVYHAKFIEYCEVGRTDSIRSVGITYKKMEEEGVLLPVVKLEFNYLRPARYDDLLTIRTFLKKMPSDHRLEFEHEILNESKKLLCTSKILLYFIEKKTNSKIEIPAFLVEKLKPFFL